jgi:hypothetical protein
MRPTEQIVFNNLQEVFSHIYKHFVLEDNPQSFEEGNGCVYDITGCAIGCCLTKEMAYEWQRIKRYGSVHSIDKSDLRNIFDEIISPNDLQMLQSIHDSYSDYKSEMFFQSYMRLSLNTFAKIKGLTYH